MKGVIKAAAFGIGFGTAVVVGGGVVILGSVLVLKRYNEKMDRKSEEREALRAEFNEIVEDL